MLCINLLFSLGYNPVQFSALCLMVIVQGPWVQLKPGVLGSAQTRGPAWVQLKPGFLGSAQTRDPWFSSNQGSLVQLKPEVLGSAQARIPGFSSSQGSWVQLKPGVLGSAQARGPWFSSSQGSWVQLKPGVLGPGILGLAQARDQLWAQLKPGVCWLITLPYIIKVYSLLVGSKQCYMAD